MAKTPIGDLDLLAEQIHDLERARGIADDVRSSLWNAKEVAWSGNRATRFKNDVSVLASELTVVIDDLSAAIRAMRNHYSWIEQQHAELSAIERRVRTWAAANPAGSGAASGQPDASVLPGLPIRYHPTWRTVAQMLRRRGVQF